MLKNVIRLISLSFKPIIRANLDSHFSDQVMLLMPSKKSIDVNLAKDKRWVEKWGEDHNLNALRREFFKLEKILEKYGITVNR